MNTSNTSFKAQIGQIIMAKDFGNLESDYIVGEVTYVNSTGVVEGIILERVVDFEDVTGEYDDGFFSTFQNGSLLTDNTFGDRLSQMHLWA
jgi:hypothetical protein